MIDEEWMRSLEFDSTNGRITGLAGIGSQWIVFNCTRDGEQFVLKVPNTPHLGWNIHEIPPVLTTTRQYQVARLNSKLLRLVGNELIDSMCEAYNDLHSSTLRILHREGLSGLARVAGRDDDLLQAFAFLLHTPGMKRRLEDLAFLDLIESSPSDVVLVNEMSGLIEDTRQNLVKWASENLSAIDRSVTCPSHMAPTALSRNPLYVWGAAVLDGFFTADEMTDALTFIIKHHGRLTDRDDALIIGEQVFALQALLAGVVTPERVRRFIRFCSLAGFQLVDEEGRQVPVDRIAPDKPEPAQTVSENKPLTPIPRLVHPSSVPRFPEEGRLDPLGQNEALLREAELRIAKFLGAHARRTHAQGIAVSLPQALSIPEWERKPWRSVVDLHRGNGLSKPQFKVHMKQENDGSKTPPAPVLLRLLQRCLVSLSAFDDQQQDTQWNSLAEALEHFGFLALCHEFDVSQNPKLNAVYEVGKIAANLHEKKCIHGDLHLGDFRFDSEGKLTSMFDLGRACILDRELTLLERAGDLATLKKHCQYLEWEAAKLGYHSGAPEIADAVFAQFMPAPGDAM